MTGGAGACDALAAFDAYEAVRHRLPRACFPAKARRVADLGELADEFDVFLLDAFGVLNIGNTPVAGAPERVACLQAAGKIVMLVSNAAGFPMRTLHRLWQDLGYDLAPDDILCSREVMLAALAGRPKCKYGLLAIRRFGLEDLEDLTAEFLGDDRAAHDDAEAILCFSSAEWNDARQALLEASLARHPRPVLVANPDIVAPRENGLSRQIGDFAHRLADATGIEPEFFGKPFGAIFEAALGRLPRSIPKSRILMVGDTLQTDILGGASAGLKTALVTGQGSLDGLAPQEMIARSGITPDYILPAI